MRRLAAALSTDLDELSHVDLDRVAICFSRARKRIDYGIWASLTPLRFAGGSLTTQRGRRAWTIQRLYGADGQEMLYILRFYLPRFFDQTLDEKLNTVIHELWHISPAFDGDLRRHGGRCYAHGASQKHYDAQVDGLRRRWLDTRPDADLYGFLAGSMEDLIARHGAICGLRVARPRLIPLALEAS
jgi:predicted metallopeptidase